MGNTILLTTVLKGWREMKKWLLVLLVLGLSVPAIADVFVYNFKQSGVDFYYDGDVDAWVKSKSGGGTTYVVVQVDSDYANATDINIWSIDTWKEKETDEDTGKTITIKYYSVDGPYTMSFLQTLIAKKTMWIVEGDVGDEYNSRIMLSGQAKSTKIGTVNYIVAATLSGYSIDGSIGSGDVEGGTVSLKLNSTITKALVASDEDVLGAIDSYFGEDGLGYEPG
jgi:hypothetical protein